MHIRYELFFYNDTATTEIYTLSLHDALPISRRRRRRPTSGARRAARCARGRSRRAGSRREPTRDWKSTRLNSSHTVNSYAVLCLIKKTLREEIYIADIHYLIQHL